MEFETKKMRRFVKNDRLLEMAVKDMMATGLTEENALEVTFNSYVLEDSHMEDLYTRA